MPDIDVVLQELPGGATVSTAKTQLDGRFHLKAPNPGSFRICWKAGGLGSGCNEGFAVSDGDVSIEVVPVRPKAGVIYGKVLTADGRPCWLHDPFFNFDVSTKVSLLDGNGQTLQPDVSANVRGEYAFGSVGANNRYIVRARCEKASGQAVASLGGFAAVANITLPNHAPQIGGLAAFQGGHAITRAPSGAMVEALAEVRDSDGDPVEYIWRVVEDSGSVTGTNDRKQQWKLASRAGLQTVYLMARDGKGGYAYKRLELQVGGTDVGFSGTVIDETTQNPVVGAAVTVNGLGPTSTNAQGWFRLAVPPVAFPERYVLNISHPQYALLSRIHDNGADGNTYELIRVQSTTHNPGQVIDVVDVGSSGPCGGKEASTTPARPFKPGAGGKEAEHPRPCRHRGAHLVLPAGVLVNSARQPVTGPVKLAMATLNPARRSLPGDYRAVNRLNQPVEMLSFGAVFVDIRDAGGNPLNLKPGSTAEIRVPVSDEQRPSAKPTIAIWSYDAGRGLWVEEGQATLQNTAEGWMYVGPTKHFSTLNMDVAGNDPVQATCVRFQLGQSLTGWNNLVLRAYVSYAGTSVQVKETALDSAQYHAIYRIPYAPPAPPPNTLRLELRGTYGGVQVVLLNNLILTDAPRPKMTGTNLWPDYPYAECGDAITLEADPVTLPFYGNIDATGRPAFLTGPRGQFLPANGDAVATAYYNTIDPGGTTNPNLSAWWTNHGFNGADGSGGTRAAYLNHNDLGFGRDMNCKTTGSDLACFVTNYGAPDQNPANADAAENRVAAKRLATVAMEYKASEPADRRVRFFVYNGGNPATAGKLKFADLDGLGPKPVPHLCIVCHGGIYSNTDNNVLQGRFREFDLPSFKYSGNRSWDFGQTSLTGPELTAFAGLNQMVRDVAPNTSPIKDLINNWYPGGFGAGTAPVQPNVPAGWAAQVNGYHNVYAKSCRTCHIARDAGNPNSFFVFNTFDPNYKGTSYAVCGFPKLMPNAFVTYKNFWSDLQRVIDYKNLTGAATCQ